jgi:hypothetical protein
MRSPGRKRPRKSDRLVPSREHNLDEMADKASYIISTEHKKHFTSAGPGSLRSDASACPKELGIEQVTDWLKEAIRSGDVSADIDLFPRYVWTRIERQVYEARLSNSTLGQYKGYPIHEHEAPRWLK